MVTGGGAPTTAAREPSRSASPRPREGFRCIIGGGPQPVVPSALTARGVAAVPGAGPAAGAAGGGGDGGGGAAAVARGVAPAVIAVTERTTPVDSSSRRIISPASAR